MLSKATDLLREKGTMLRKFVVILTMLLCSMATQLYALGLGTVTVESSLNQPLRMRIELLQLGDTRLQDIRVSMASGADFERFNIERDSFLSNIRFSVESTPQGNVVILSSSQIVREPYLSFILDTRWPNGRLLSEHTILLDLPVFNDRQATAEVRQPISPVLQRPVTTQASDAEPFADSAAAPAVSAPSSTNSAANLQPEVIAPEPEAEPADEVAEQVAEEVAEVIETAEPEPEPEQAAAEPEVVAAVEETVEEEPVVEEAAIEEQAVEEVAQAEPEAIEAAAEPVETEPEVVEPETIETDGSDTLSDIALQVRPNTSVSMQQTMLALQELNPDAFADGNINRLRSGQVLRVPTLEEVQAIDPRDAVDEVTRQNQEFAETDVQPLAAPATATPDQDDQPQGQLSVVSADESIDATGGAAELGEAENTVLDQRIAELEAQLAQRQEEADRARIEREELDSRMADLEEQIAAAQEIIRLQDIQLAQLQDSLAAAAAEAQLVADQQAIQDAAAVEAAQPLDSPSSLLDDVLRILTGNIIFMISGIVLVILLLVVLMLRRNRAAKTHEDDIDELVEKSFETEEAGNEDATKDESATEFQDYDSSDLDSELDDIIGVSDEGVDSENAGDEQGDDELAEEDADTPQLDVITIADQLIAEQQYRRALSMLNTSLQEQGDSDEVREKITAVEVLLAAEDAQQQEEDEAAKAAEAAEAASRESETKSFLDDLGIDLDSFDYDDDADADEAEQEEAEEIKEESSDTSASAAVSAEEDDDVDMMFDLGGDDDSDDLDTADSEDDSADDDETFEFDLDDDSNAADSEANDTEDLDIDTLEFDEDAAEQVKAEAVADEDDEIDLETFSFDANAAEEVKAEAAAEEDEEIDLETFSFDANAAEEVKAEVAADEDEEIDLETFSFDADAAASVTQAAEESNDSGSDEDDPNAVEFSFDKEELEDAAEAAEPVSNEDVETFDFDLDDDAGDTVLEKPDTVISSNSEDDIDEFDFDLDEFEVEPATEESVSADADAGDDFLDLDTELEKEESEAPELVIEDDEIEFDIDSDDEPVKSGHVEDADDLIGEADLEFLSDDDVEIESVDDIEEIDMLSDDDETATKLELAYAYQKMGDAEGAKEILREVIKEGSDEQIAEANKLLGTLDSKSD